MSTKSPQTKQFWPSGPSKRSALWAAILLTGAIASVAPGTAAPAKSTGTILQYDEEGRVIGRIKREFSGRSNEPALLEAEPTQPLAPVSPAAGPVDDHVPGEILAVSDAPDFAGRVRGLGFPVLQRAELANLDLTVYRLRTPAALPAPDALLTFRTVFPSAIADLNGFVHLAADVRGWDALGTVGWPRGARLCGQGISIGMIDTGVHNPDNAITSNRLVQRSFLPEEKMPARRDHGTAIAGLLIGNSSPAFDGLLPGARLFAANIFEETQTGQALGNVFALVGAFDWMIRSRVDVLNLSLETGRNDILSVALEKAMAKDIVITAAAGNGGAEARPAHPAAHPDVLAVTAVDPELRAYAHANRGDYIDFAAPGVSLWTATTDGGRFQSGTSFAVPFLTAAVAMQMATGTERSPAALRDNLSLSVRDLGAPGKDSVYGWGLLTYSPECAEPTN